MRPKNSAFFVQCESHAHAAAVICGFLRLGAEWHKRAVFPEIVLTHPAVCSLRQYRNLRLAVSTSAPAATSTSCRSRWRLDPVFRADGGPPNAPSYTVAAFDLGGGTTDINAGQCAARAR